MPFFYSNLFRLVIKVSIEMAMIIQKKERIVTMHSFFEKGYLVTFFVDNFCCRHTMLDKN